LFQSGVHSDLPGLIVNGLGSPIPSSGWISVHDLISDVASSDGINVCLIVDGDVLGVSNVALNFSSGVFSSVLELSSYSLADGLHTLSFYAVADFYIFRMVLML
jgi:hypothetical protein